MSDSAHRETARRSLEDELTRLEAEIGRQRLHREKVCKREEGGRVRTINTSNGPVVVDPDPPRHINTSSILEEDMQYLDGAPEIISVLPATGWHAVVGGEAVALIAFVAMDDGRMHGVAVDEDGRVDLTEDVEKHPAFSGYVQTNHKEEK